MDVLARLGTIVTDPLGGASAIVSRQHWERSRQAILTNLAIQVQHDGDVLRANGERPCESEGSGPDALREISPEDLGTLFAFHGDPTYPHYWSRRRRWLTFPDFVRFLREMQRASRLMVAVDAAGAAIGYVQLLGLRAGEGTAFLAFYLSPSARSFAATRSTVRLAVEWVTGLTTLRKLYCESFDFESYASEALEEEGFLVEGITPGHYWYRDRYWARVRRARYFPRHSRLPPSAYSEKGANSLWEE